MAAPTGSRHFLGRPGKGGLGGGKQVAGWPQPPGFLRLIFAERPNRRRSVAGLDANRAVAPIWTRIEPLPPFVSSPRPNRGLRVGQRLAGLAALPFFWGCGQARHSLGPCQPLSPPFPRPAWAHLGASSPSPRPPPTHGTFVSFTRWPATPTAAGCLRRGCVLHPSLSIHTHASPSSPPLPLGGGGGCRVAGEVYQPCLGSTDTCIELRGRKEGQGGGKGRLLPGGLKTRPAPPQGLGG